jgi:hypothetical protein
LAFRRNYSTFVFDIRVNMKKGISILLLLVMLVAGAHPVLAFHFCGGELYSFGIAGSGVEESCCSAGEPANASGISQSHTSCCDIQKISISTDDYQNQPQQINYQPVSIDCIWLAPERLSYRIMPEIPLLTNNAFPPGGLAIQHMDILTGICIFRI